MENKYIMSNDTTAIAKLPIATQANNQNPVQSALANCENIKIETMDNNLKQSVRQIQRFNQ